MAEARFALGKTDEHGITVREHLEKAWRQTGRKPALLEDEPHLYPAVQHIWEWFCQLSATRGGGFGPASITFAEIDAWARRLRIDPDPWEIEQVMAIDRIWLKVTAEENERKTKKSKKKDKGEES